LYADPKLLQKLHPHIGRALLIDPNPAAARLLGDQLRSVGVRNLMFEPDERRALDLAAGADPQLIFVERSGPRLDGEVFTRRLRRSDCSARRAPVIMVTADATASTIKGARDSGVHEFLRKPFTASDLLRRIEAVALTPRDWVEAVHYVGPDRRRFNSGQFTGARKRRADAKASAAESKARALDQALRILRAAISHYDNDPVQARRAMAEQAALLRRSGVETGSNLLTVAAGDLEEALALNGVTKSTLVGPARQILRLFEINAPEKAA
jgi:CheY-like chemotaxis protein